MVTHVMSDGTKRESIEGLVVPEGHPVYKVIQKMKEEGVIVNENEATNMVTHVMSDGTKRESIEGLVVPEGHPVYKVIQKMKEEGVIVNENEATQRAKAV